MAAFGEPSKTIAEEATEGAGMAAPGAVSDAADGATAAMVVGVRAEAGAVSVGATTVAMLGGGRAGAALEGGGAGAVT